MIGISLYLPNSYLCLSIQTPASCGSTIDTGDAFTLQEDILDCDCSQRAALTVDGQGTMLNLNGHTVQCSGPFNRNSVIEVVGKANTIMGPGRGEYIYNGMAHIHHLCLLRILITIIIQHNSER